MLLNNYYTCSLLLKSMQNTYKLYIIVQLIVEVITNIRPYSCLVV